MKSNASEHSNGIAVCIGIAFLNTQDYLEAAILSVINQSYSHWQLILLNDGSTDKSLQIANTYASSDSRISVISDGQNKGLPYRLNELSKLAQGKYYFRMDADDIMHPNRLETQIKYLEEHKDVDLVGSGLIAIDNDNQIIGVRKGIVKDDYSLSDFLRAGWCVHPTIAGKLEWFKNNRYDENLRRSQDYDLWLRTIEHSTFAKIETPLLFYREASTPSLKKYRIATLNSLKIFKKNIKIIGFWNFITLSIYQVIKFLIYFFYDLFGYTDSLIDRRSLKMEEKVATRYYQIMNQALTKLN